MSFNDYVIAAKSYTTSNVELFLLNLRDNLSNINTSIVPPVQLNDISRYRKETDRQKRLLSRSFLYEYLGEKLGVNDFQLAYNNYQKPLFAAAPHIRFSFSYANGYVLIGISNNISIGVDIEWLSPSVEINEIAGDIMCPSELNRFLSIPDNSFERRFYFFSVFSAKESIIKSFGTGLYYDVREIETLNQIDHYYNGSHFVHTELDPWLNEYTLSVCVED